MLRAFQARARDSSQADDAAAAPAVDAPTPGMQTQVEADAGQQPGVQGQGGANATSGTHKSTWVLKAGPGVAVEKFTAQPNSVTQQPPLPKPFVANAKADAKGVVQLGVFQHKKSVGGKATARVAWQAPTFQFSALPKNGNRQLIAKWAKQLGAFTSEREAQAKLAKLAPGARVKLVPGAVKHIETAAHDYLPITGPSTMALQLHADATQDVHFDSDDHGTVKIRAEKLVIQDGR